MKKTVYLLMLSLAVLFMSACAKEEAEETTTAAAAVTEEATTEAGTTDIDTINEIVKNLKVEKPDSFGTITTLCEYKGMAVEIEKTEEITDEYVMEYLEEYVLGTEETSEPIVEGDVANIDYVGKINGEAFSGGSAEGTDLTIGSGTFIDGFEDGLIGKKAGETVDLNLRFPINYGSTDLAGKDAVFTVTINYVTRTRELTDAYAKELGFDSAAEMQAFYKRYLVAQTEVNIRYAAVLDKLVEDSEVEASPEAVEYMTNMEIQSMAEYYEENGVDIGTVIVSYAGMSYEEFVETYIGDVMEETVKKRLLLDEIAKRENITVTDEDIENFQLDYGVRTLEELKSAFADEETLRERVLEEKATAFVSDNAVFTYTEE